MRGTRRGLMVIGLAVTMTALTLFGGWDPTAMAADKAPAVQPTDKGPTAIIKTKFGEIEIKLFPDKAPKHVENFIKLAKSGFYNGTIFHRVIPGFMIQGGDPNTKDLNKKELYGMSGRGHSVKAESNDIPHKRGIVSMARSNAPDSAGSQFFIVLNDSRFLDNQYTVFGRVVNGMDVVDKIAALPTTQNDQPQDPNLAKILSIKVVDRNSTALKN